jgi:hypothetical protein
VFSGVSEKRIVFFRIEADNSKLTQERAHHEELMEVGGEYFPLALGVCIKRVTNLRMSGCRKA